MRFIALAIAPDVWRDDLETGVGDRPDLVSPRVPQLGKTVNHDNKRTGTFDGAPQGDPVRLDLLETERLNLGGLTGHTL
jgi:hypothetical protein|tara:strand:+ start:1143 stop:1379 length:237 start_codon:yes stop_codon:yes gene_type:complete